MPSLFKSLLVAGAAALAVFASPISGAEQALAARGESFTDLSARALAVPRAVVVSEQFTQIAKRSPESLEFEARGGDTLVSICADVKAQIQVILDDLNVKLNAGVKIDASVLVNICLNIKAIIDAAIVKIKVIALLPLTVILGIELSVFAGILLDILVQIIACLKICVSICVTVDLSLVLAVIAQISVSLAAFIQLFFNICLGLNVLFCALLTVDICVDIKALALVDVIAVIKAFVSADLLAALGL